MTPGELHICSIMGNCRMNNDGYKRGDHQRHVIIIISESCEKPIREYRDVEIKQVSMHTKGLLGWR